VRSLLTVRATDGDLESITVNINRANVLAQVGALGLHDRFRVQSATSHGNRCRVGASRTGDDRGVALDVDVD
jgi:hypothetical protein